jgi:hypothetical protein
LFPGTAPVSGSTQVTYNGTSPTVTSAQVGSSTIGTSPSYTPSNRQFFNVTVGSVVIVVSNGSSVWNGVLSNTSGMLLFSRVSGSAGLPSFSFQATSFTANASTAVADLSGVDVNLSETTAVAIRRFRLAARIQQFLEMAAKFGGRAFEHARGFFGSNVRDDVIQRPVYLGSFRNQVLFSEVRQTSESSSNSPQGNLSGYAVTGGKSRRIKVEVKYWGWVMAIAYVMPKPHYQQGLHRSLIARHTRYDYWNPLKDGTGDQDIMKAEIYADSADPMGTFGYVGQGDDLRYMPNRVSGLMETTFNPKHFGRIFATEPVLSQEFRTEQPQQRAFSIQGEDCMQCSFGFGITSIRSMPKRATVGIHKV